MRPLLALAVILSFAGCGTAPEFSEYQGPDRARGTGGMVQVVQGMDVWVQGTPPRRYRILGMMQSTGGRHSDIDYETEQIVKAAEAKGADALIVVNADDQPAGVVGYNSGQVYPGPFGMMSYGGSSYSRIITHPTVEAVLIKYE